MSLYVYPTCDYCEHHHAKPRRENDEHYLECRCRCPFKMEDQANTR